MKKIIRLGCSRTSLYCNVSRFNVIKGVKVNNNKVVCRYRGYSGSSSSEELTTTNGSTNSSSGNDYYEEIRKIIQSIAPETSGIEVPQDLNESTRWHDKIQPRVVSPKPKWFQEISTFDFEELRQSKEERGTQSNLEEELHRLSFIDKNELIAPSTMLKWAKSCFHQHEYNHLLDEVLNLIPRLDFEHQPLEWEDLMRCVGLVIGDGYSAKRIYDRMKYIGVNPSQAIESYIQANNKRLSS